MIHSDEKLFEDWSQSSLMYPAQVHFLVTRLVMSYPRSKRIISIVSAIMSTLPSTRTPCKNSHSKHLFDLILYVPVNNLSVLPWLNLGLMCLAQGPQRSDTGEA